MSWLTLLVAGLTPRENGFNPRPLHVGPVADEVTVRQVFLQALQSSPAVISLPTLHIHSLTHHQRHINLPLETVVKRGT